MGRSGQAITEYILLLFIVVVGVGYFISKYTGLFDNMTVRMGGAMEAQLRTGKAPASVWTK
jgi:hypothetical protein